MIRLATACAGLAGLFSLLLVSLARGQAHGFLSSDVTGLWARSMLLVDGPPGFTSADAFYPPLPLALSLLGQSVLGGASVPVPALLSALLGAAVLLIWFVHLRDSGRFGPALSAVMVGLIAANPFFLRAVAAGPPAVLCILGMWIFAQGIVRLRLTGNAPEMMKVAVGLVLVALSDGYGLMICFGALPFMIVAARPGMIAVSAPGYLVAMFYPVAAAIGSVFFIAMIFDARLLPQLIEPPAPFRAADHAMLLAGLLPVTLAAMLRNLPDARLFVPLLAAAGTVLAAYMLNRQFNLEGDPAIALAPLLGVFVCALGVWSARAGRRPGRRAAAVLLPIFGLVLSVLAFAGTSHEETRRWSLAMLGSDSARSRATGQLGAFLAGRDGIMVDAERNPDALATLGGIDALIVAGDPAYDRTLAGGVLQARYVLVPKTVPGGAVSDRILRRFPELKQGGVDGYQEVFGNARFRVLEKTGE